VRLISSCNSVAIRGNGESNLGAKVSRNPYLAVSDLGREYFLNLELVLVAATATNKTATERLDELLESVVKALPSYARLLPTGTPYEMQTNNAGYLAINVPIELEITI